MTVTAIVGAQWGDEGKGRIIDYLAQKSDCIVMRFQGGDNAGHTVVNEYGKNALHLVPCGIFNPKAQNVIAAGCVVNPQSLLQELDHLESIGVNTEKLWISNRAQLLMPYHRTLDELEEAARGNDTIGTTKRGVGPAYSDKATRSGLRMGDLLEPDWLEGRLDQALRTINRKIELLDGQPVDGQELYALCMDYRDKLGHRIIDIVPMIRQALKDGTDILLEGQLGVMRDLDWGIYPYVTSSNPTAAFAATGAGLPARSIEQVMGIAKAYSTAVGAGPFPVELNEAEAKHLRTVGGEFGATTGRARRCGWFDGVAINYAVWLNGMTSITLTKLDILDEFESIKICIGYKLPDGTVINDYMPDTPILNQVEPIYEEREGWMTSTQECRQWDDLPPKAQRYVMRLRELAGVPIQYVSVGPERDQLLEISS